MVAVANEKISREKGMKRGKNSRDINNNSRHLRLQSYKEEGSEARLSSRPSFRSDVEED